MNRNTLYTRHPATGMFAVLISAGILLWFAGCAKTELLGPPQDPPLPVNDSLLPLDESNWWKYSYNVYDQDGSPLFHNHALNLKISRVWGVDSMSSLTELFSSKWSETFKSYPRHFYGYEWESSGSGYLLAYQTASSQPAGFFITGTYSPTATHPFDSARLWLAYPATKGTAYSCNLSPDNDTSQAIQMEVMGTDVPFFFPLTVANSPSPLRFASCYLYRETRRDTLSYYYFAKGIGCVGFQQYIDDRLIKSYILTSCNPAGTYYRY